MARITVYTQVYNAGSFLEPCISSVLNQTFKDFEYIIVDSASTDGSTEKLKNFAAKDPRIHLIILPENDPNAQFRIIKQHAAGEYLACLDHDDWWDLDCLERLLDFLEKNRLDYAMTGTIAHYEANHAQSVLRKLETPVILTLQQFAQFYPQFWTFPSTRWASLIPMRQYLRIEKDHEEVSEYQLAHGGDTVIMLRYLEQCRRIGIDNTAFYHYRIHKSSQIHQYNKRRFDANIAYYEEIKAFLVRQRAWDEKKQEWLKRVHIASMVSTMELLAEAALPDEEKLAECSRIAAHPLTAYALTSQCSEREQWYMTLGNILHPTVGRCKSDSVWRELFCVLAPRCCAAISKDSVGLLCRESKLMAAFLHDDRDELSELLLDCIRENRYVKQFDIVQMFLSLIPEGSPLRVVRDTKFLKKYPELVRTLLYGQYEVALDEMTGLLLDQGKVYCAEDFLQLYLTLAALEEQTSAFLFGKIRLAQWYQREGRTDECWALLRELEEMGAGEVQEVAEIKIALLGGP